MKISLQKKMLAAFLALVILVLAGVAAGGSSLIRKYLLDSKRHELTDKAYEMARMVNAYYDGHITIGQLHNFVNSVDSFLDARIWVVDKKLNLITVSEERPDEGHGNRRPVSAVKPSPLRPTDWDCDTPGNPRGMMMPQPKPDKSSSNPSSTKVANPNAWSCDWSENSSSGMENWSSGGQGMMGMRGRTGSSAQPQSQISSSKPAAVTENQPAADTAKSTPFVLDAGKGSQQGASSTGTKSLSDIKGSKDIIREIEANWGKPWSTTYFHPYYEENMLIVAVPLQSTDQSIGGTVMIYSPVEEIDAFLRHIYYYVGLVSVTALLAAMLLAGYMARGIARPLKAMKETAAAMAYGDYSKRVDVSTRDEVGDLGQSLNALAEDMGLYVQRLEKMDKMRSDFVANVSHELRTPLTIMRGYNQALQDGTITDPEKVNKYRKIMGDEILRLEKLISDLLELSQLQANGIALEMEAVSLAEILDNVAILLKQKSVNKGVQITVRAEPSLPPIQADGDRLTQLVLILMDNALKFTPKGGRIIAGVQRENNNEVLTIQDTGEGIAAEDLPHIWERFYKADKSRTSGGTGLGLAIAKQIIELHGAQVDVTSAVGEGTTFTMRFPVGEKEENER